VTSKFNCIYSHIDELTNGYLLLEASPSVTLGRLLVLLRFALTTFLVDGGVDAPLVVPTSLEVLPIVRIFYHPQISAARLTNQTNTDFNGCYVAVFK
jgi:hypothetical protein